MRKIERGQYEEGKSKGKIKYFTFDDGRKRGESRAFKYEVRGEQVERGRKQGENMKGTSKKRGKVRGR